MMVFETLAEVHGYQQQKNEDWFDDNHPVIHHLLEIMHAKHRLWLSDKCSSAKRSDFNCVHAVARSALSVMKDTMWSKKKKEFQEACD